MIYARSARPKLRRTKIRHAFTLVEMLVVTFIIVTLVAITMPAIQLARESARSSRCQSNLRQFGIGLMSRANREGAFCSGNFDWDGDGCVTEIGWVADMVNVEIPAGKMLCPSNPFFVSDAYADLLELSVFTDCVEMKGRMSQVAPDGTMVSNPCRAMIEDPSTFAAGSEARRVLVEQKILNQHFNTNYTASWVMVRSQLLLDSSGNLAESKIGCGRSLTSRNSTKGPLTVQQLDNSVMSSAFIPMIGDGAWGPTTLSQPIGSFESGLNLITSVTRGPVVNPTMDAPADFPDSSPKSVWWPIWARQVLQDYRAFAPLHNSKCNILFADGSIRSFIDENEDGLLNNGFSGNGSNGFRDSATIELPHEEFESRYSLMDEMAHKL